MIRSPVELVVQGFGPGRDPYFEREVRPFALAEIWRRRIDVAKTADRIRSLVAELRRLPPYDLMWVVLGQDAEGVSAIAFEIDAGREPLDPDRLAAWAKAGRSTKESNFPTPSNKARPGTQ